MAKTSENTKQFLERAYGKELTDEEINKYKDNLVKFFGLLVEIDRRENVTKTYGKTAN